MARVSIQPITNEVFTTSLTIRVTDLNYGNHLANQNVLVFAHEARIDFLASLGVNELDFYGVSLIQGDAAVVFKSEGFLKDKIEITIGVEEVGNSSFDLVYFMFNYTTQKPLALVKTGLVCFDYSERKVRPIPKIFKNLFV
ncbi:MAG: acyl-CoA thioester hydrolase [Bacteroidia bacterium]|jgi:acyl-CoA thioester hydrolase